MTVIDDYAELSRLAEELRALQAVQNAAGDLGRARRYSWPADRQAILAETLASARARLAAVKERRNAWPNEPASQRNGPASSSATEEVAERDALMLRLLAQGLSYKQVVDGSCRGSRTAGRSPRRAGGHWTPSALRPSRSTAPRRSPSLTRSRPARGRTCRTRAEDLGYRRGGQGPGRPASRCPTKPCATRPATPS